MSLFLVSLAEFFPILSFWDSAPTHLYLTPHQERPTGNLPLLDLITIKETKTRGRETHIAFRFQKEESKKI